MPAGCSAAASTRKSSSGRMRNRVKAVHYKDMKITGQEAPLGKGMVDLKACFQFARANGALQIVDMDAATLEDTCRAGKMLSGWTGDRDNTDSILCTMDVETGEETVCLVSGNNRGTELAERWKHPAL